MAVMSHRRNVAVHMHCVHIHNICRSSLTEISGLRAPGAFPWSASAYNQGKYVILLLRLGLTRNCEPLKAVTITYLYILFQLTHSRYWSSKIFHDVWVILLSMLLKLLLCYWYWWMLRCAVVIIRHIVILIYVAFMRERGAVHPKLSQCLIS